MNLCSEKHDEICHEGHRCPACNNIDDLEGTIQDLEKELREANATITAYEEAEMGAR